MKQTDSKGLQTKRTRVTILLEQIQTVLLKLVKKNILYKLFHSCHFSLITFIYLETKPLQLRQSTVLIHFEVGSKSFHFNRSKTFEF